jgi:hypothetical protein
MVAMESTNFKSSTFIGYMLPRNVVVHRFESSFVFNQSKFSQYKQMR